MSDPLSGGVGAAAGFKAMGGAAAAGAAGAGLAAVVAMMMMTPRSPKEWAVGLISTVMASIGGGAFVIRYFGLQDWVHDPIGLVGMLGLVFACGLPGWALVRWLFNFIEKRKADDFTDIVREVKDVL